MKKRNRGKLLRFCESGELIGLLDVKRERKEKERFVVKKGKSMWPKEERGKQVVSEVSICKKQS